MSPKKRVAFSTQATLYIYEHSQMGSLVTSLNFAANLRGYTAVCHPWGDRCPHAKLYCFELANGRSVVVIGSANASAPAWLGDGALRNAELVVVHEDAGQLWKRLGLHRITAAPPLAKSAWAAIKERVTNKEIAERWPAPSLAIVTLDGFIVDEAFAAGVKAERVQVFTDETATAAIQAVKQTRGGILLTCASEEIRGSATRLEVAPTSGSKGIALVQHVSDLLDRAAGSIRQAFRRALAMEADPEQLTALMKVVEKAIFDEPVTLDAIQQPSQAKPAKGKVAPDPDEPETLVISAKDTVKARRRRRLSASSDLAVIIDALIYRLGQPPAHAQADCPRRADSPRTKTALRSTERYPALRDRYRAT
jgi:hypothetical protein